MPTFQNLQGGGRNSDGFIVWRAQNFGQKFDRQNFLADNTAEILFGAENSVRRKILSAENFVRRIFVR